MSERQSFYVGVKGVVRDDRGVFAVLDAKYNKWELPGGRIDGEESMETSFRREMNEEVPGAIVHALGDTLHVAVGDKIVENDHRLLLVFRIADVTLPQVVELSDEHTNHGFITAETIDDFDLYGSDREAVERALGI